MPRALTNKQILVLNLLRAEGPMTALKIAERIHEATLCPTCGGSGEGANERCASCYGRGKAWFGYSNAYQAAEALRKRGLTTRDAILDPFGDPVGRFVYSAAAPDPNDPLEALWALPEADRGR